MVRDVTSHFSFIFLFFIFIFFFFLSNVNNLVRLARGKVGYKTQELIQVDTRQQAGKK